MSRERERLDEIAKKLKTELYATSTTTTREREMGVGRRSGGGGAGSLNTITPCAACKLLRRRCAEECPFSPYFSPHEPHKFAVVHKVFGASNVSKLLMEVHESQRGDAANSLVYEANVRLREPVYGCMGAISALQQQVQSLQAELHAVRTQILTYKYTELAANTIINAAAASTHAAAAAAASSLMINHHHHSSSSSAAAAVNVSSNIAAASADMVPQPPTTPPPPPTPPPPLPSVVVPPSSSSSSSSLYSQPCTSASFNAIANNNIPFFD